MISLILGLVAVQVPTGVRPQDGCATSLVAGETILVCPVKSGVRPIVKARIDGKATILLIEPSGDNDVICNPDFITRAGIFGHGPYHVADVGPIKVLGAAIDTGVEISKRNARIRVKWSTRKTVDNADCIAGPRGLPFNVVRFNFGGKSGGVQAVAFPFHGAHRGAVYGRLNVGRHDIALRFQPRFARSVVTASAAHAISSMLGGTATGPVMHEEIGYGIMRPIRALPLSKPLQIGGLAIRIPFVRVADYGQASQISSVESDELLDGEVVVNARRRPPGTNRFLRIGADDVGRCESLTVDKKRREFILVC